jgi:hypothetical protein
MESKLEKVTDIFTRNNTNPTDRAKNRLRIINTRWVIFFFNVKNSPLLRHSDEVEGIETRLDSGATIASFRYPILNLLM